MTRESRARSNVVERPVSVSRARRVSRQSALRVERGADAALYLGGELDLCTAAELEEVVERSLDDSRVVVLDLADLSFVDASGIRAFLRLARRVRPRALVLRGARPNVSKVFRILDSVAMPGIILDSTIQDRGDGPGAWALWTAARRRHVELRARTAWNAERTRMLACIASERQAAARGLRTRVAGIRVETTPVERD